MAIGSRSLQMGTDLKTYLENLGLTNIVMEMILEIRNYLAQFSYRPSMQEIIRWLWYWCSGRTQIETLVEGNQWYSRIPPWGSISGNFFRSANQYGFGST